MAVRKSRKAVAEYDPLSWLKEDAEVSAISSSETDNLENVGSTKVTNRKRVVKKKSAAKKTVVKKVNADQTKDKTPQQQDNTESTTSPIEGTDFGFFGDDETAQAASENSGNDVIALDSELTIKNVSSFKQLIDDRLLESAELRLDPSDLQKIDTAGLQLLFSLKASLGNSGRQIEWTNPSEVITSAAKIIGMESLLDSDLSRTEQDQGFGFF